MQKSFFWQEERELGQKGFCKKSAKRFISFLLVATEHKVT